MLLKAGYLGHPQIVGHELAVGMPGRQFATNVPELFQVTMDGALGGFDTERRKAAGTPLSWHVVAPLNVFREREELLEAFQRTVRQCRWQSVVGDDSEPIARIRRAHRSSEAVEVGLVLRQVNRLDGRESRSHGRGL